MFREIDFDLITRLEDGKIIRKPARRVETMEGELMVNDENDIWYKVDWEVTYLLQYVGMFDKIGKKIYHGHILKDPEGECYDVQYACGAFFIVKGDTPENSEQVFLTESLVMTMEIVGDVFQNPDLILKEINQDEFNKKVNNNLN